MVAVRDEKEATEKELREVLVDFWLEAMQDPKSEWEYRVKASELLARYILGDGKVPVRSRGSKRPPTTEVLKMVAEMERNGSK